MKRKTRIFLSFAICILAARPSFAEYSRWSLLAGLDLIINTDGENLAALPGMGDDGTPGGLDSGPSPIATFVGAEYRLPVTSWLSFAPSGVLYAVQYRFEERPLPTEIENRTAYVPSLLLDLPLVAQWENGRFSWFAGGGLGILARWAFLEPGVPADAINTDETLTASEQVSEINGYNWASARWFYPTLQAGLKYRLETGWGGGLALRTAIPVFNLWSSPEVPFIDSLMITAALTITPPASSRKKGADASAEQKENPSGSTEGAPEVFLIE